MAATSIFVLPTAIIPVGVHGPFVSPAVGAAYSAWQLKVTPGVGWPTAGGSVLEVTIEKSVDGGQTWAFDASIDYGPGPWKDKGGNAIASDLWITTMGKLNPGQASEVVLATAPTDLFRVTLNALQACNATISFGGLP